MHNNAELREKMAPFRVAMPRAERLFPWLRHVLDLYAAVDMSVDSALRASGRDAKCRRGCTWCCRHAIPVTPLEVSGLLWFAREEMRPQVRERLQSRLDGGPLCRFCSGGVCAAYIVRPVACRRYMVLGAACGEEEDVTLTRPEDLLRPDRGLLEAAYALALPYYAALGDSPAPGQSAFSFMAGRTAVLGAVSGRILGENR